MSCSDENISDTIYSVIYKSFVSIYQKVSKIEYFTKILLFWLLTDFSEMYFQKHFKRKLNISNKDSRKYLIYTFSPSQISLKEKRLIHADLILYTIQSKVYLKSFVSIYRKVGEIEYFTKITLFWVLKYFLEMCFYQKHLKRKLNSSKTYSMTYLTYAFSLL